MGIKRLRIAGFKSIDSIELTDLPNYCVFAGANGAGKSNFFDSLKFASAVIDDGVVKAIRQFRGYRNILHVKRSKEDERSFHFECNTNIEARNVGVDYSLAVYQMNQNPALQERLTIGFPNGSTESFIRNQDGTVQLVDKKEQLDRLPQEYSMIMMRMSYIRHLQDLDSPPYRLLNMRLRSFYKNFRVFRFDPFRAKEPDDIGADPRYLDEYGRNLSTVLETMQKKKRDYETIMEWMSMIVPGLEKIHSCRHPLDGRASMMFQETGTRRRFPSGLISDGTIYVLCLLLAVLTRIREPGITMIEEPERGIHPQAIEQLSLFFREYANDKHLIFISTHNESFVRNAKPEELFFVVKEDGQTHFRLGRDAAKSVEGMPNDKAWLQNMFDGGLPW